MSVRVLVAFDSFKDALSAERACEVVAGVVRGLGEDIEVDCAPLSDGGEGFARVMTTAVGGELVSHTVTGPAGRAVGAGIGFVDPAGLPARARSILFGGDGTPPPGQLAIVEMASASGLPLLPIEERDPWRTTSRGTGELLRAAALAGAGSILLGIGGSGTSDLGLGALEALGLEFMDVGGEQLPAIIPAMWPKMDRITGELFPGMPPISVACDVENPLLGPKGAVAIYGPQKGLSPADIPRMDQLAGRVARLLCQKFGNQFEPAVTAPGAGAAGGMFFGLGVAFGARAVPGFDLVSAWLDLESKIAAADLVISGEGRFDETSFSGKAVGRIVSEARRLARRCVVFAGSVGDELSGMGEERVAITPPGVPLEQALVGTERNLAAAVSRYFVNRDQLLAGS